MGDRQIFENCIRRFIGWLDKNGASGFDPYDLWSTQYGIFARRHYYRYGSAAALLAAPVVLADRFIPSLARAGVAKKPYATSDAHLILALLDLDAAGLAGGDWLRHAATLAEELDRIKIAGYSGDCWGYPFDWENRRGFWPRNTPLITVTPYAFEALIGLHETTGTSDYRERARSIAQFALRDLNDIERSDNAIASSYSPLDRSLIINASAYRAFLLIKAADLFCDDEARALGARLVRFVLDSQRPDGAWTYALEARGDDFIDHFHTCFVLKNLFKVFKVTGDQAVQDAIQLGYKFYEENLFDKHDLPRPFASGGSKSLKYNLYDFAEAINLGILLYDLEPRSFERSLYIARETADRFQLPDGHFVTSVRRGGSADKLAFIRWPQAQMFHAFASLWRALT